MSEELYCVGCRHWHPIQDPCVRTDMGHGHNNRPCLVNNDFFVVITKCKESVSPNYFTSADLSTASYFSQYEDAVAEARERAVNFHVTVRIYRASPAATVEPQEPKVNTISGDKVKGSF